MSPEAMAAVPNHSAAATAIPAAGTWPPFAMPRIHAPRASCARSSSSTASSLVSVGAWAP